MKRIFPSALKTFLMDPANRNCHRADLFAIHLPTGQTLFATDGQWDVSLLANTPGWGGPLTTFAATQYGRWTRGPVVSEAGVKVTANTTSLVCVPQPGTMYPGLGIGILNAALNHLFDGATVWIYTAYMPLGKYGTVVGVETKFRGTITKAPGLARNRVEFEVADPLFLLNMKVPSRLMQSNCGWGFTDQNCTLDATHYTVDFAIGQSSQTVLWPTSSFGPAEGYFAQGVVTCLTGRNAGLSQTVKANTRTNLTITLPWLLPVAAGDTFRVIKGCDKTAATCAATTRADGSAEPQNFRLRFGGTPFAPVPSTTV